MHLAAVFQYSTYIELATIELEKQGLTHDEILVIPFESRGMDVPNTTLAHVGDPTGINQTFIFGAILMLLGSIYGFIIPLGPVLCAIIGLVLGGLIGYSIDRILMNRSKNVLCALTEVVLIVKCREDNTVDLERVLWEHQALAVTKVPS